MTNGRLSPYYQQQSHLLFERHQKGEISRREYGGQKKQLVNQEVQSTARNQTVQTSLAIQEYEAEQLAF